MVTLNHSNGSESNPWNPTILKCNNCGTEIYSKWPGNYRVCSCGQTMVDETREYMRTSYPDNLFTVIGKLNDNN